MWVTRFLRLPYKDTKLLAALVDVWNSTEYTHQDFAHAALSRLVCYAPAAFLNERDDL